MYRRFKEMPIDHAAIGLMQREECHPYFCTPKDACIIGWAGVDGIHYCTVPEFGELIFAVSPMNMGDYVHPIAENFRKLLELLLTCGDMAALEQCYAWDEEQFKAFLLDCPITAAQQRVLDALRAEFDLEPAEDAFGYVKELQRGFDLSKISYTEDYYDIDMNPAAPVQREWRVTYEGGFWDDRGKAGEEIPVGKHFRWGEESWYIPAVYLCPKGLVVDFCREVDPEAMLAYIEKWDLYHEERNHYTKQQQEQMTLEHPMHSSFHSRASVNGKTLTRCHGYGTTWLPASCVPAEYRHDRESDYVIGHYGLDESRGWSIHRCSYPWATARKPKLKTLALELERDPEQIPGLRFASLEAGDSIAFTHPHTGRQHTLTVLEYTREQLPGSAVLDALMEHPRQYTRMAYTVTPEAPGLMLRDCEEGDLSRPKRVEAEAIDPEEAAALALIGGVDGPVATSVASIGMIGGADGPTTMILGRSAAGKRTACSSLRFEPAEVEWQLYVSVKRMEDISVEVF